MNPQRLLSKSIKTAGLAAFLMSAGIGISQAQSPGLINRSGDWNELNMQGYSLYTTRNDAGSLLEISCDVATGRDEPPGISVIFNGGSASDTASVEFGIDGQKVIFAAGLGNMERDQFERLWALLRAGSKLQVSVAGGQSATFSLRGSSRILPDEPC